jgi:Flp pilus assembly protein TadD
VAVVLTDLALLLKASNRSAEAERLERQVLAINDKAAVPAAALANAAKKSASKSRLDEKDAWKREIWSKP